MKGLLTLAYDNGTLTVLDQTRLPVEEAYVELRTVRDVFRAIETLQVRGAPAIGAAAAYGLAISARNRADDDIEAMLEGIRSDAQYLVRARPTAVNLRYAVERVLDVLLSVTDSYAPSDIIATIEIEADAIQYEDAQTDRRIGENLLSLLHNGATVLTHCNAGMLATTGCGTALSPFYLAKERGMELHVIADETRPLLQGARLTAYELMRGGIDVTLICDSMAAFVLSNGLADAVIVGCDRVAANGDTANKIGTLGLAVIAKHYGVPLYVAAPTSTIDMRCASGDSIPIEMRDGDEVRSFAGTQSAPAGVNVMNPAFDVTPNDLISAIVTERGILLPPFGDKLQALFQSGN
ncbi:MAG: S-methyl-5-thioribose-1-phosphate isomerase [Clostridia bacterium]|nr:S-methyl-5-thioribose-1-phosphate isomerase [Clostridia bacterium]